MLEEDSGDSDICRRWIGFIWLCDSIFTIDDQGFPKTSIRPSLWQSTFNMENRQCYGVRNSCEPIVSVFVTGKMAMVFPHKMAMLTIFG